MLFTSFSRLKKHRIVLVVWTLSAILLTRQNGSCQVNEPTAVPTDTGPSGTYDFSKTEIALDRGGGIAVCQLESKTIVETRSLGGLWPILVYERGVAHVRVLRSLAGDIPPTIDLSYVVSNREGDMIWKEPTAARNALLLCVLFTYKSGFPSLDDCFSDEETMKKVPASTSPANHWHAGRVELLKGENDPLIDAFVEVSRLFKLRHKAAEYEALLKAADDRRSEVRTYLGDLIVNHLSVENPFVAAELEDRLLSTPSR